MGLKNELKKMYRRVGGEVFCRGIRNTFIIAVLAIVVAVFSCILSFNQKDAEITVREIRTSEVTYQTAEENKRIKEPVTTETIYYVIEKK